MKKLLCLLLALLMLLPMVVACKNNEQGDDTGSEGTADPNQTDENGYNMNILDTLPSADYDGKKFNVSMESGNDHVGNFNATELTGVTENDTLYKWLTKVEQYYDTDIVVTADKGSDEEYVNSVLVDLQATDDTYHLYGVRAYQAWQIVVQKLFLNWNSLSSEWIDLEDAQRWDVATNEAVTFNGKFYTATGDLGVSKLKKTMTTYYHVKLLEEYGADNGYNQDYIYGLVNEGKWTLEAMEEIAKDVYFDNNDNGEDGADTYGYYSYSGNSYDIWVPAMGITAYGEDSEGRPVAQLNKTENITKLEKVHDFYHLNKGVMPGTNTSVGTYATGVGEETAFVNGNALFVTTTFANAYDKFQVLGTEAYGMMPQPKYDEDQDYYMSYVNDQYDVWGINANLAPGAEQDFAAHITDALCKESSDSVYYVFYDVILKGRYSKDKATAEMVDKIMENVMCDASRQFGNYLTSEGTQGYTGAVRGYLRSIDYNLGAKLSAYELALSGNNGMLNKMYEAAYQ